MRFSRGPAAVLAALVLVSLSAPAEPRCGGVPPPSIPPGPAGEVPPNTREPSDPPPDVSGPTTSTGPVTPGGGDGDGPVTGGPNIGGPTTGGGDTSGPTTGPGGGGPQPVGGGPATGPTTDRRGDNVVRDRDDWKYWWWTNRAELLDLHARAIARAAATAEHAVKPADQMWRAYAQSALTQALADPEPDVVAAAALALGRSGDVAETRSLVRLLVSRDEKLVVRTAAALGLGLLPGGGSPESAAARNALRGVARDADERDSLRAAAVYALGERGEEEAVPDLVHLARAGGRVWDVPAAALSSLGISRCAETRGELERLLTPPKKGRDREWMRRVYAAHGLARLGGGESLPAVLGAMDDDHPDVRRAAILAAGALAKRTDAAVRERLTRVLEQDHDRPCRYMATLALGRIGGAGAVKAIRREYDDADPNGRAYAALALGLAVRDEADDADFAARRFLAREFADRPQVELRGALAIACGIARASSAAPELRKVATGTGDPALRGHCALALGLMQDPEASPLLIGVLESKADPDLQGEAALALGLLGEPKAIAVLGRLVESGSTHRVQAASAIALGRIGGESAAKLFTRLLGDPSIDAEVREGGAIGLGMLLDRREGRSYTAVAADLDWYATTNSVREIVDVH